VNTCPTCGAQRDAEASFCEQCGHDFSGGTVPAAPAGPGMPSGPAVAAAETQVRQVPVRAQTAAEGEESPLDVGWTGPVGRGVAAEVDPVAGCAACGVGTFVDGYCDQCGVKQPDPRDHFHEEPAAWLAGVCDIGARKKRNEDAMALLASTRPLQQGVVVVCDGVSNSTDSHIASLAAARAAREVLDDPIPHAMGQPQAIVAAITQRLARAVLVARDAVVATTADAQTETPPSCTFVAALIDEGTAVVGNVGDSRAYWLPDAPTSAPIQLGEDDSFAAEQMREGMPRKEAETGAQAHAITRWLGVDSPADLTPHTAVQPLTEDGWLLLCSDGLWNYCSEPTDLRELVARTVAELGPHGRHPLTLAQRLVDFANAAGGVDNITVAAVRVGATDPAPPPTPPAPPPVPEPERTTAPPGIPSQPPPAPPAPPAPTQQKDAPDGTVHD
jgi:serine/threonine protein phosphatase PrpC